MGGTAIYKCVLYILKYILCLLGYSTRELRVPENDRAKGKQKDCYNSQERYVIQQATNIIRNASMLRVKRKKIKGMGKENAN